MTRKQNTEQSAFDFDGRGEASTERNQGNQGQTEGSDQPPRAQDVLEAVFERSNLEQAWQQVKANKGAAGIDGVTVEDFPAHFGAIWETTKAALLNETYQPQPVLRVSIPKPDGGKRQLGIPTVLDRLIQQALYQVLEPIFDPTFSDSSFGFRAGRSCHQAIEAARQHVAQGREWVVDIDLEKFFDNVNHDIVLSRMRRKVGDKRVLRLIRRFLRAGAMEQGMRVQTEQGTPQGGPLSPLLANIVLDDLDKELERRGLTFCRYADDCNIFVRSQRAGERVKAGITTFIKKRLKLKVNEAKSGVAKSSERKFVGFRIVIWKKQATISIFPQKIKQFKDKIRKTTRRTRRIGWAQLMEELNPVILGWGNYFRIAKAEKYFRVLDAWIRHRLRSMIWTAWQTPRTRYRRLRGKGVPYREAWELSQQGIWRATGTKLLSRVLSKDYLKRAGYKSLLDCYYAYSS